MNQEYTQNMTKNGVVLGLFALVTTGLIALTFFGTQEQIAAQQQNKLKGILNAVVDPSLYNNALHLNCVDVLAPDLLGSSASQRIYRALKDGQPVAAAIKTTAPDGYSGKIELVVGVQGFQPDSVIVSGVRVLEHKETPGLGDKIESRISDWIYSFNQKTYADDKSSLWAVKKDGGQFDQFTGATITPRAVVNAVKRSAEYIIANQASLFSADNACAAQQGSTANPTDVTP
jgi:electron transport complex protein RnfG